jgi:hypothetical protein
MKKLSIFWLALSSVGALLLMGANCGELKPATYHRSLAGTCASNPDAGDACLSDPDCGATGVCSCKGETFGWAHVSSKNVCVPSNCRSDSDCKAGACSPTVNFDCGSFYGVQGYYCHTAKDTCHNDSDCGANGACAYQSTVGYWECSYGHCAG